MILNPFLRLFTYKMLKLKSKFVFKRLINKKKKTLSCRRSVGFLSFGESGF